MTDPTTELAFTIFSKKLDSSGEREPSDDSVFPCFPVFQIHPVISLDWYENEVIARREAVG
jgi:hypothetical protein